MSLPGVGDIVTIAQISKLAWDTFTAIKNAPKEWRALESEVQSLAISLKSLDDADTTLSIVHYTKGNLQREQNLKDLLTNSSNALAPMKVLIGRYRVKDVDGKREIKDWLAGTKFHFKTLSVQEFRDKLALHTASLNIFLTTLTNTSLGRLEQLIINGQSAAHAGLNLMAGGKPSSLAIEDGFEGVWAAIGRDLALGIGDKESMSRHIYDFREDIREYVQFIVSGGLPYSKHELSDRRRIRPHRTTHSLPGSIPVTGKVAEAVLYSLEIPIEQMEGEGAELKNLVDAMVSFDGNGTVPGSDAEDEESFENPPSPSRSSPPATQAYNGFSEPSTKNLEHKMFSNTTVSSPSSQMQRKSYIRCDACNRDLLVGEMYLHCKICHAAQKEDGYDVCDPCWEKGKSCPGKHRDERYFNHRERRIAEED